MTDTGLQNRTFPHLSEAAAYVAGGFRTLESRADVLEKATGGVLGTAGLGSNRDLDDAVAAARTAQPDWAAQPYSVRAQLMRDAAARLAERADEFADLIVRETGSIRGKAEYEASGAIDELYAAADLARRPRGEILVSQDPGRESVSERVPVGVVAAITPWNFPLILAMRVVAPAIALEQPEHLVGVSAFQDGRAPPMERNPSLSPLEA